MLEVLSTRKNVLHPSVLKDFFHSFMVLTNKQEVKPLLKQFLKVSAFLGHTKDYDMHKLVQVFRRIYKHPSDVEDIDDLLNLTLLLALTNTSLEELDSKSRSFIEESFEVIRDRFKGYEVYQASTGHGSNKKEVNLHYYPSFEFDQKFKKTFKWKGPNEIKPFELLLLDSQYDQIIEFPPKKDIQAYKAYLKNKYQQSSLIELQKSMKQEYGDDYRSLAFEDFRKNQEKEIQVQETENKEVSEGSEEEQFEDKELSLESGQFEEENELEEKDIREIEFETPRQNQEVTQKVEQTPEEQFAEFMKFKVPRRRADRTDYDSRAAEGLITEEHALRMTPWSRFQKLNKTQKHIMVYTNYDQVNIEDINKSQVAKAWAVLFHFKSQSQDSILFEQFNSIVKRNSFNKTAQHQLFQEYHSILTEESYQIGAQVKLNQKCDLTGWQIDVMLQSDSDDIGFTQQQKTLPPQQAVYFMLREEMCFNMETNREEPLGLQKLMLKHVKSLRGIPVNYLSENQFLQLKSEFGMEDTQTIDSEGEAILKSNPRISKQVLDNLLN